MNPSKKPKNGPLISYYDSLFLESDAARQVRLLSEYIAPQEVFNKEKIKNTIVFFGSARTLSTKDVESQIQETSDAQQLKKLNRLKKLAKYYDEAQVLAQRLSKWMNHLHHEGYAICTGGGPGIMEAGNRGADDLGTPSIGLNIKLPFEQHPNPYITDSLNFQFRYFFIRKFWFLHLARAIVVFPGGFGTLDELFEVLTLVQTKKYPKNTPIVLYGSEFWKGLIQWDHLVETGMIDEEDLSLFKYSDSIDETYEYITQILEEQDSKS